jgi:hypothetical protein
MDELSVELLTKERAAQMWPTLEPLVNAACRGNKIANREMDASHVLMAIQLDKAAMFVGSVDKQPACVLVIQFFEINGHKGADVMALAGRRVLRFKAAFWEPILIWLKANDIEFLDAYTPTDRAEVYLRKFGFTESCAYVRMNLGVGHE